MANERKYFVKQDWIFNLESMHDKLWCVIFDMRDAEVEGNDVSPVTIAGRTCKDEFDVQEVLDECEELAWIAKSRKVTSREYGRIKQIVEWRVNARYMKCLANGMNERDAGKCFEDL